MRILVITKRQYTGQDLLDDRFGRLREIPLALARRGHDVRGLCLSYANRPEGELTDTDEESSKRVLWESINAGALKLPGFVRYMARAKALIADFRPDVIWAGSDSLYGIIGTHFATKTQLRCVFDLYDNFESFATVSIPGVRGRYHRAVREAHAITCVSDALRNLVKQDYGCNNRVLVLENAVRKDLFFARDQRLCRQELGLPERAMIVGVAGALSSSRGIDAVFEGFARLAAEDDSYHLAVAGARDKSARLPAEPWLHDLGMLPLARVPVLLCAMDVAVIPNKDSAFGRYCFPQKFYEIVACRTPFVAADIGSMRSVLVDHPQFLFRPGDPVDFARAVQAQIQAGFLLDREVPTWDDQAARLDEFLHDTVQPTGQ